VRVKHGMRGACATGRRRRPGLLRLQPSSAPPLPLAVYVDELNSTQLPRVPLGMVVRHHSDFQTHVGSDYTADFGFRGAAMFLDLYRLFPSAQWYVSGDDDTFFGERCPAQAQPLPARPAAAAAAASTGGRGPPQPQAPAPSLPGSARSSAPPAPCVCTLHPRSRGQPAGGAGAAQPA
jgi:hypothetical protein